MKIHIENLSFEAIIGLLPKERHTPQKVCVDMEIDYTYTPNNFLDYAKIALEVENHICTTQYELLEDAIEGIKEVSLVLYPTIKQLSIKITKPDILPTCRVGVSKTFNF